MQENTWARLRELCVCRGTSHATYPRYFPAYLYVFQSFSSHKPLVSSEISSDREAKMSLNFAL